MIRHIVLLNLPEGHDTRALSEAMALLETLVDQVPGILDFTHGANADYEAKSGEYDYGFTVDFTDRAAHLVYERHPDHQRAGAMLVAMCTGGHDGIFVADLRIGKSVSTLK